MLQIITMATIKFLLCLLQLRILKALIWHLGKKIWWHKLIPWQHWRTSMCRDDLDKSKTADPKHIQMGKAKQKIWPNSWQCWKNRASCDPEVTKINWEVDRESAKSKQESLDKSREGVERTLAIKAWEKSIFLVTTRLTTRPPVIGLRRSQRPRFYPPSLSLSKG